MSSLVDLIVSIRSKASEQLTDLEPKESTLWVAECLANAYKPCSLSTCIEDGPLIVVHDTQRHIASARCLQSSSGSYSANAPSIPFSRSEALDCHAESTK
jgi:hypothetical protein